MPSEQRRQVPLYVEKLQWNCPHSSVHPIPETQVISASAELVMTAENTQNKTSLRNFIYTTFHLSVWVRCTVRLLHHLVNRNLKAVWPGMAPQKQNRYRP